MKPISRSIVWFAFLTWPVAAVYTEADLRFLEKYLSSELLLSNNYQLILCRESDKIDVARLLSKELQVFVTIQTANSVLKQPTDLTTFLLHSQCPQWTQVLRQAEKLALFRKPYRWILLTDETSSPKVSAVHEQSQLETWNFLQTLPLFVDSDFRVAVRQSDGNVTVISPYKISPNDLLIREVLAEWNPNGGMTVFNGKAIALRRQNLRGLQMVASLVITNPDSINHMEDLVDRHVDTTSKVTSAAIKFAETIFNISISYKIESDWGRPLENGSWTGMVGDLQKGIVEIGASPIFWRADRLNVVEYYAEVAPSRLKFIFVSPPLSHSSNVFMMPFSTMVWVSCLSLYIIASILLYFVINLETSKKSGNEWSIRKLCSPPRPSVSFLDILVYNMGAICQQGTAARTYEPAGRIITLFVYLTYLFLYVSYSAAIVAILQSSDTSIQTLSDLLASPMAAGADEVAYSQFYFKTADDPLRKKFYAMKITPKGEPPHFYSPEIGIRKVQQGLFAFHVENSVGYQIVQKTFGEDEKCSLQELKNAFFDLGHPWLVMRKYSPFSEMFRIGLKKVIEVGFKSRGARRFYTKKPVCGSKSSRFFSIGLVDCYSAFMILVYGSVLAVIVLTFEAVTNYYLKRQTTRSN